MRKMTVKEMVQANGGGWKCRFGDFYSSSFWPTYWHCFWSHSVPLVSLIIAIIG